MATELHGVMNFVKRAFGGLVCVEEVEPYKPYNPKSRMSLVLESF